MRIRSQRTASLHREIQEAILAGERMKKPLAWLLAKQGALKKPRQYLLSRLLHYHRLEKLNYCVRDGNRCGLSDIVTGKHRGRRLNLTRRICCCADGD